MIFPTKQLYRIGEVEVDPARGCIRRAGQEQHLRRQTFQVLLYLLEQRHRLVSREELIEQVWQGAAVTDDAVVQSIVDLRKAFGDDPRHPRFIKTVPKAGYRFIADVEEVRPVAGAPAGFAAGFEYEEVTSVEIEVEEEVHDNLAGKLPPVNGMEKALPPARHLLAGGKIRLATVSGVAVIVLVAVWLVTRDRGTRPVAEVTLPQFPGKRAIAVVYFENQSGERELNWLREGLADMLITNLSRSKGLTVLSRQQLSVLLSRLGQEGAEKLGLEDSLEIAQRSRAETVVTGSFARLGEKMRVDVRLLDGRSGQLRAAESLTVDRPDQILSQIDVLSLKLAARLGAAMTEAEARPGLAGIMTDSLDAYRYYSLALENAGGYHSNEALALLEKAVALDPQFAMAFARIGYIHAFVRVNEGERAKPYLERAFRLSSRLTEKEKLYVKAWHAHASGDLEGAVSALYELIKQYPQETEAYFRLGFILRHHTDRKDEALHLFERAAAIDPDAQDIHNQLGFLYQEFGRYDEAIVAHQRYVQLAPREPNAYDSLGMSYAQAGRYEEAIQALNQALALNPEFHFATRHLGDVYFCLGRFREALDQYRKYLKTAPSDWDRATACNLIVRLHLAKNDWAQAERVARQEWRYHNDFGGLLLTALARNDMQAAEKLRSRISERSPNASLPFAAEPRVRHHLLGLYAMKAGRTDEALQLFSDSQRMAPFYWNIDTSVGCLARAYLELGRFDQAITEYERLSRVNPNWALTQYWLGVAYDGTGGQCKARAAYARFLQLWQGADPDLPEVIKAKERLTHLHCSE